jgi:hypothetical protein
LARSDRNQLGLAALCENDWNCELAL